MTPEEHKQATREALAGYEQRKRAATTYPRRWPKRRKRKTDPRQAAFTFEDDNEERESC